MSEPGRSRVWPEFHSFFEIKKDAAPGVDGLTRQDYEAGLESKLKDLHARLQRGAYRALPSRRVYIP